jgi:hypothetical protein
MVHVAGATNQHPHPHMCANIHIFGSSRTWRHPQIQIPNLANATGTGRRPRILGQGTTCTLAPSSRGDAPTEVDAKPRSVDRDQRQLLDSLLYSGGDRRCGPHRSEKREDE